MRWWQRIACILLSATGLAPPLQLDAREPAVTLRWSRETQCYEFDAKGSHLIRYYGWYSNKSRGMRKQAVEAEGSVEDASATVGAGYPCKHEGFTAPGFEIGKPVTSSTLATVYTSSLEHMSLR